MDMMPKQKLINGHEVEDEVVERGRSEKYWFGIDQILHPCVCITNESSMIYWAGSLISRRTEHI
jgi:hypothetical protein